MDRDKGGKKKKGKKKGKKVVSSRFLLNSSRLTDLQKKGKKGKKGKKEKDLTPDRYIQYLTHIQC